VRACELDLGSGGDGKRLLINSSTEKNNNNHNNNKKNPVTRMSSGRAGSCYDHFL
jgi:hypothetical protein